MTLPAPRDSTNSSKSWELKLSPLHRLRRRSPARPTGTTVTAAQARIAWEAYRDYGKGSGHPANLNFGDCLSYALAREKREPILFKGNDFVHTDLRAAVKRP